MVPLNSTVSQLCPSLLLWRSASGLLGTDGLLGLFLGTMPATFHHWCYYYYTGLFSSALSAGRRLWTIVDGSLLLLFIAMTFSALASALVDSCSWFLDMCCLSSVIIAITAVSFSALVSMVDSCGWFLGMKLAILQCYYNGDLFSSGLSAGRQLLLVTGHDAVHLLLLSTVVSICHCVLQWCPSFIVIYSGVHLSLLFTVVSIFHCYLQWCLSFIIIYDGVRLSLLFTVVSIFHCYLQWCPSFIVIYSGVHLSSLFTMVSIFRCYLPWCRCYIHLSLLYTVVSIFRCYLQWCPSFIAMTVVSIFHCYLQWCPAFIAMTMVTFSALASALVGNWGWFLGMMLSMVLFIGLIIFFIILFKRGKRFKQRDSPSNSFYGGDAASYSGTYADSKLSVQLPVLCFLHSGLACPALSLPTPDFVVRRTGGPHHYGSCWGQDDSATGSVRFFFTVQFLTVRVSLKIRLV